MRQQRSQPPRKILTKRLSEWRDLALPGLLIIGLICLVRISGLLQVQEWMVLDTFSRSCPPQKASDRIALVSVDAADYQALGEFPLSSQSLMDALVTLKQYQPRVIGLDIYKDLPLLTGKDELYQLVTSMPNVVTVEVALDENTMTVSPPPGVPPAQVGFADIMTDADGKMRRIALTKPGVEGIKYSLALQLVRQYLRADGVLLQPGHTADDPIRIADVMLSQFRANSGGYVRADASGHQILMNFCMLQRPYDTITLRDLLASRDSSQPQAALLETLRDRIVIIGNIDTSAKDSFITAAVRDTLYSARIGGLPKTTKLIYGIEAHAHAVKQIVSSVLDRPCVLTTWPNVIEYLWIVVWGFFGISLSVLLMSPWKSVIGLAIATLFLLGAGYIALNHNLWIPVVPTAIALCGAGLVTAFFDRDMRFELVQQKIAVERTYEAFHNGPLQRLAAILRSLRKESTLSNEQRRRLQELNIEMRGIFERMRQDTNAGSNSLYLIDNTALDLQQPLPVLLYQVYETTLNQNLPGFSNVESYIFPNFEDLQQGRFKLEQKRGLCLFLQEALINIGKYGAGATRIDVICQLEARQYRLQIVDNGPGLDDQLNNTGQGTRQAVRLARQLKGTFRRVSGANFDDKEGGLMRGVLCEIIWPK